MERTSTVMSPVATQNIQSISPEVTSVLAFLERNSLLHKGPYWIQGGYFETAQGPDTASYGTLLHAMKLGNELKQRTSANIRYTTIVNDLGISCDTDTCTLDTVTSFSEEEMDQILEGMVTHIGVPPTKIVIMRERWLRNRGIRRMKSVMKSKGLDPYIRTHSDGERIIYSLATENFPSISLFEERGNSRTAKCPLIMAAFYAEMGRTFRDTLQSDTTPIIIDFCAYSDRDRVVAGVEVRRYLFSDDDATNKAVVVSVCCDRNGMKPVIFLHGTNLR